MGDQISPTPITCHCWNADRTKIAFCPNNNEIHIMKREGNQWVNETILKEHDQVVTGLDWGHKTNRIVSCSEDRNAYVWTNEGGQWKPVLVILRINRCATYVKWSPLENKFAVASGAKCVSVCYFEEENDWWVSKHIKRHSSTVLSLDWHPNNTLLATASSDMKARVFAAAIKGVDRRPPQTPFGVRPFGECLAEYPNAGWVHSVKWNPSGTGLAFSGHDSTVTFVDASQAAPGEAQVVPLNCLPLVDVLFLSDNKLVGVGHDCNPKIFENQGGQWKFVKNADAATANKQTNQSSTRAAFSMFQNKVETGQSSGVTKLNTKHQNCITRVTLFSGNPAQVQKYATTGLDGKLVVWPAN